MILFNLLTMSQQIVFTISISIVERDSSLSIKNRLS